MVLVLIKLFQTGYGLKTLRFVTSFANSTVMFPFSFLKKKKKNTIQFTKSMILAAPALELLKELGVTL